MTDELAALTAEVQQTFETVRRRLDELTAAVDALARGLEAQRAAAARDDAPRLFAVELAVAGATRADVDARLRERFGLASTVQLLNEVFGSGSSPAARLPWA